MANAIPVHGTEDKPSTPKKQAPSKKPVTKEVPDYDPNAGAKPGQVVKLPDGTVRKDF